MKLTAKEIIYTEQAQFTLYPLGDIHLGTIHCDRDRLQRYINRIEMDPHALWIGMGDMCDCIVLSDPRFVSSEVDHEFRNKLDTIATAQRDALIKMLAPIAGKCLGLLSGNHEFELRRRHYVDIIMDACRELGVEELSDTAFLRVTFKRHDDEDNRVRSSTILIYAEHGNASGRKPGASVNRMEDLMGYFDADLYLSGHNHRRLVVPRARLTIGSRGSLSLIQKVSLGVYTGSFYKTYEENTSSYGQRKSLNPTVLGSIPIRINPRDGTMIAEV